MFLHVPGGPPESSPPQSSHTITDPLSGPSQAKGVHSMVHLRLKESHSPGQFHTLACRCSGHPPKGWGSCRWGRCPHGNSGWVAMLSLEGVPPGAAATAAPSGTRTDDTLGPSWCGLQWPEGLPVMTPRAEAHQGPSSPGAGTPALFTPPSLLAEAACWLRLLWPLPPSAACWAVRLQIKERSLEGNSVLPPPNPGCAGRGTRQGLEPGFISWAHHPSGSELT